MEQKPIPDPTIQLDKLIPPVDHYTYFANHTEHPFRYSSGKFQMVNAWWLAEAAMLAYSNDEIVAKNFRKVRLSDRTRCLSRC